jgi:hypothetical protein
MYCIKLPNICDEDPSALRPESGYRSISGNMFQNIPQVKVIVELLEWKSSGSGLENRN